MACAWIVLLVTMLSRCVPFYCRQARVARHHALLGQFFSLFMQRQGSWSRQCRKWCSSWTSSLAHRCATTSAEVGPDNVQFLDKVLDMPVVVQRRVSAGHRLEMSQLQFGQVVVFPGSPQGFPCCCSWTPVIDDPGVREGTGSYCDFGGSRSLVAPRWTSREHFTVMRAPCSTLLVMDLLRWYSSHQLHRVQFPHCLYGRPGQQRR